MKKLAFFLSQNLLKIYLQDCWSDKLLLVTATALHFWKITKYTVGAITFKELVDGVLTI